MEELGHGCAWIIEKFNAFSRMQLDVFIDMFMKVVNGVSAWANRVQDQWPLLFDPVRDAIGVIKVREGDIEFVDIF